MAREWEEVNFNLTNEEVKFLLSIDSKTRSEILHSALLVYIDKHRRYLELLKIKDSKKRREKASKDFYEKERKFIDKYVKGYSENFNNYEWFCDNTDENKEMIIKIIGQDDLDCAYDCFECDLWHNSWLASRFVEDWINKKTTITENFYFSSKCIEEYTDEIIRQEITKLDYKTFLNTAYWKLVADKTKEYYQNKCVVCDSTENLNAHHKTYKRHGEEHLYYKEDLVCLCKSCHEKYHEIKRGTCE